MSSEQTIFEIHQSSKNIHIERVFTAKLDFLWRALSEYQTLDQWYAPDGYSCHTVSMLFEPTGSWLFYMLDPDGHRLYQKVNYMDIDPLHSIETMDSSCDENGKINREFPVTKRIINMDDIDGHSARLMMNIDFEQEADVKKYIDSNFETAFIQTLDKLDTLISNQSNDK